VLGFVQAEFGCGRYAMNSGIEAWTKTPGVASLDQKIHRQLRQQGNAKGWFAEVLRKEDQLAATVKWIGCTRGGIRELGRRWAG
jgi:hypothetical protein